MLWPLNSSPGSTLKNASRAGVGTLVGGIAAFAIKFGFTIIIVTGFLLALPGSVGVVQG